MAMLELLTLPYAFYLLYLSHWDDQNSKFFRIIVLIPRRDFCFPIIWWLLLWLWLSQTPQISTSNICHAKQISSTSMTAKDDTHHAIPSSNSTKIRRMQLPYTKKNGKILHSCSIAEVFLAFGELSQVPLHKDSTSTVHLLLNNFTFLLCVNHHVVDWDSSPSNSMPAQISSRFEDDLKSCGASRPYSSTK